MSKFASARFTATSSKYADVILHETSFLENILMFFNVATYAK